MKQISDSGPGFRAVAPNVPKMAQNTQIVTSPAVFELESSFLRIMLTYSRAKNSLDRFFSGPFFGLRLQTCPKWHKTQKIASTPTVFEQGSLSLRMILNFPGAENLRN